MANSDPSAPRGNGGAYQWIRSNSLGLVAIFIALSGSAVAAQVASQPDGQKAANKAAKKKKAKRGPPGPAGLAGPAGPAGAAGLQGPAGTSLGPITRGVSLPLGSFQHSGAQVPIDWTADDGTAPNFTNLATCCDMVIEYDDDSDGGGSNVADLGLIASTFTVPQDFSSNGVIALRVSKDAHAGVTERLIAQVGLNGAGATAANAATTTAANTEYVIAPGVGYAPGDAAYVLLQVQAAAGPPNSFDDIVRVHSVEFRYTATQ